MTVELGLIMGSLSVGFSAALFYRLRSAEKLLEGSKKELLSTLKEINKVHNQLTETHADVMTRLSACEAILRGTKRP